MRFIILFEFFQYLYYLRSYSTFCLPEKGIFCLMESSPFLVTFCLLAALPLNAGERGVMCTKEDIEVE